MNNSPVNNQTQGSIVMQGYASNIISINGRGRNGALQYPVASGYTAMLLDEENGTFYIKSNDPSGIPRPLREFKYEEITPPDPATFDPSQFATKDDFNLLLQEIRKIQPQSQQHVNNNNNRRGGNNAN